MMSKWRQFPVLRVFACLTALIFFILVIEGTDVRMWSSTKEAAATLPHCLLDRTMLSAMPHVAPQSCSAT